MLDDFLSGYRTILTGSSGAGLIAIGTYFHIPMYVIQAIAMVTVILELVFIRIGMKTETEKKILAYGKQLSEVANIIVNKGNLPTPEASTTPKVSQDASVADLVEAKAKAQVKILFTKLLAELDAMPPVPQNNE